MREGAQDYLVKGQIEGGLLVKGDPLRHRAERRCRRTCARPKPTSNTGSRNARRSCARSIRAAGGRDRRTHPRAAPGRRGCSSASRRRAQEVEAANRSKDEFLAILSHELRTPLNAILGWSEILRTGEQTPEEVLEGVEVIERNARSQARLVEDVLEVSRIICGKIRLNLGRVDLVAVVDAALASARPTATGKNITLRQAVEPLPGALARRRRPLATGGVEPHFELPSSSRRATARSSVRARQDQSHTEIAVSDSGIGIPPDFPAVRVRPFPAVGRVDDTKPRRPGARAFDLAPPRRDARRHDLGRRARAKGRGATFTVFAAARTPRPGTRLKATVHRRRPTARRPASGANPAGLANVRVLVVDDETDSRRVVVRLLNARREPTCARRIAPLLSTDILAEWPADVLISDIAMPGEDGYGLIRRLRTSPDAMPADAAGDGAHRVRAPGGTARNRLLPGSRCTCRKPFDPAVLLSAVTSLASLAAPVNWSVENRCFDADRPPRSGGPDFSGKTLTSRDDERLAGTELRHVGHRVVVGVLNVLRAGLRLVEFTGDAGERVPGQHLIRLSSRGRVSCPRSGPVPLTTHVPGGGLRATASWACKSLFSALSLAASVWLMSVPPASVVANVSSSRSRLDLASRACGPPGRISR